MKIRSRQAFRITADTGVDPICASDCAFSQEIRHGMKRRAIDTISASPRVRIVPGDLRIVNAIGRDQRTVSLRP